MIGERSAAAKPARLGLAALPSSDLPAWLLLAAVEGLLADSASLPTHLLSAGLATVAGFTSAGLPTFLGGS